jgi:hypothetical protein
MVGKDSCVYAGWKAFVCIIGEGPASLSVNLLLSAGLPQTPQNAAVSGL